MPGVGVRTAATLLVTIGDDSSFPTAAHLASYAGLAPATKSSGSSIHSEPAPRTGNRLLKRAMFLSAFAALHDPASRSYYDRQRAAARPTPKPSSGSPATASASCSPCSETEPSTNHAPRKQPLVVGDCVTREHPGWFLRCGRSAAPSC
ncbi:IS110 family transposase [Streptomyces sp. NPDC048479]|uniref:IS110 family transposase n=1 Tax=Streptomyces sp. NPDC048479 TaxID=3154725 RepID=UPI003442149E